MEVIDEVACILGAKDLVEECKQWVVIYWQWLYYATAALPYPPCLGINCSVVDRVLIHPHAHLGPTAAGAGGSSCLLECFQSLLLLITHIPPLT